MENNWSFISASKLYSKLLQLERLAAYLGIEYGKAAILGLAVSPLESSFAVTPENLVYDAITFLKLPNLSLVVQKRFLVISKTWIDDRTNT